VHVVKKAAADYDGHSDGVRGFFRDVHEVYLDRITTELLISRFLSKIQSELDSRVRKMDTNGGGETKPRTDILIKTHEMLTNCLRLLNLGEYEVEQVSSAEGKDIAESMRDLIWKPINSEDSNLAFVAKALHIFFPRIEFQATKWSEAVQFIVDPRWIEVLAFGLGLNAALRLMRDGRNVEEVVYLKAGVFERKYYISASDLVPNISVGSGDAHALAEKYLSESPLELEYAAAGLRIANRIAKVGRGELHVCEPHGFAGATFKCKFPIPPGTKVQTAGGMKKQGVFTTGESR